MRFSKLFPLCLLNLVTFAGCGIETAASDADATDSEGLHEALLFIDPDHPATVLVEKKDGDLVL